ncbi:MAG: PorT family protein [Chitinophagaceae bacterium]|nr:PorT family protein [Chitinophagaceae bacterium]
MKVLLLSAALVVSGIGYAQHNVHYGLKAGVNVSNVPASAGNGYSSKVGFNGGGTMHIHLSKSWALQPEVMYSAQGGKSGNQTLQLDYINVPLQLQYMFDKGFRLQTGPQAGFLTAANVKSGNVKSSVRNNFKPVDLAWTFGASFVAPNGLGIDARYNLGLTRINEAGPVDLRNNVFQAGLFYQFKHKY